MVVLYNKSNYEEKKKGWIGRAVIAKMQETSKLNESIILVSNRFLVHMNLLRCVE